MKHFKTVVFKDGRTKILGNYAMIHNGEWGGCNIPLLMSVETTIRKLEQIYPDINFKDVKLIIVKLSEVNTINN